MTPSLTVPNIDDQTQQSPPSFILSALWALLKRPEDRIRTGLWLLSATEGASVLRNVDRLRCEAPEAFHAKPLRLIFQDEQRLADAPPGSVGAAYATFMTRNRLTFESYNAPVLEVAKAVSRTEEEQYFRIREGHLHDLRHVATGYGSDELGEVCLIAFRWAQSGHPGMGLLTALGLLKVGRSIAIASIIAIIAEAWRLGRRAKWLDIFAWEDRMHAPLAEVRAALALKSPRRYEKHIQYLKVKACR